LHGFTAQHVIFAAADLWHGNCACGHDKLGQDFAGHHHAVLRVRAAAIANIVDGLGSLALGYDTTQA